MLLPATLSAQGPLRSTILLQEPKSKVQPGIAFFASALLPGAGQLYQGKDRWVPYLALETWAWVTYANQKSRGHSLERQYRDLAWLVARRIDAGVRRDTTFPYYESMRDYHESGAFDSDLQIAGVQPETDTATYNGKQWERARALFLPGGLDFPPGTPQYQSALQYYRRNAIPFGYGWSWGESNLEQQVFQRLIEDSDDALRNAGTTLGLILANHVVSAIDALVTARLQAAASGRSQIRVGSELEPAGGSMVWKSTVRFTVGK